MERDTKATARRIFHANGYIVCAYQYGALADITSKIKRGELSVESLKAYQNWLMQKTSLMLLAIMIFC